LEAAIFRRIVRRRDHNPVSESGFATAIVGENGVRNRRRWGVLIIPGDHDFDFVGCQNLQSARISWFRESMCILSQKQRSSNSCAPAVTANRLSDSKNVPFIECALESGTPMT